jgi:queuine/archaeosine tRNA-ribosyltransferase
MGSKMQRSKKTSWCNAIWHFQGGFYKDLRLKSARELIDMALMDTPSVD